MLFRMPRSPVLQIAFLLTGSKAPLILVLGAAIAGWLGTLLIMSIVRLTRIKYDSVLAIVLSTFFGFGLVLHTLIQRSGNANQAGTGYVSLWTSPPQSWRAMS